MWFMNRGDAEQGLIDDARSTGSDDSATETCEASIDPDDFDAYMLGTLEDKVAIKAAVGELTEDDLECSEITVAVHMQIHWQSTFMRLLKVWLTFGLYLLFLPKESRGVLLLTKKGRVLNIGTSYTADHTNVFGFAWRMIISIIFAVCVIYFVFDVVTDDVHVRIKMLVGLVAAPVLLVLGAGLWGTRPRRDCGADFRQQFNVSDLCVGNYSRVDSWCCCFRRRRGHLRLCFGKIYPDEVTIEDNLPLGVPHNIGRVRPATALSPAAAGDTLDCYKEQVIERSRKTRVMQGNAVEGFSPLTAMVLAGLGIIGGIYEYCTICDAMKTFSEDVCTQKVKGCSWKVPNPENLGQMRTADHANPPFGYQHQLTSSGCDEEGEYCDVFWRELDYCSPHRADSVTKEVRLQCDDIDQMQQLLSPVLRDGRVVYLTSSNRSISSMAVADLPSGGRVWLEKGSILEKIGPSSSNESQILDRGDVLDWELVKKRCAQDRTIGKNMLFVLHEETETVDLQNSDCYQLQQACMAQNFGPDTNGWWPLSHLIHWSKKRTLCAFHPDLSQLITGEVFWHEVESFEPGLTCVGPPAEGIRLEENEDNATTCHRRCQELKGCKFAFYKPLKETFSAEMWKYSKTIWTGMPSDDKNCLLYKECQDWKSKGNISMHYEVIECGSSVGMQTVGIRMPYSAVEMRLEKPVRSPEECKRNCTGVEKRMCNGYSVLPTGDDGANCTLYGQPSMSFYLPESAGWRELPIRTMGQIGTPGQEGECYLKLPPLPSHPDRMRTGTTGRLFRRSEHRYCSGCAKHELVAYIFEWQNFATILAQIISIFGFSVILSRSKKSQAWLSNEFTGKPIVDIEIVGDARNKENFEDREAAYRMFLTMCYSAKKDIEGEHAGTSRAEKFHRDCWEWEEDDMATCAQSSVKVVPVDGQTFEAYDMYDRRMEQCFVDKELLGFFPDEKVLGAWPERVRKGLWRLVLVLLLFGVFVYSVEWALGYLPERWQEHGSMLNVKRSIYFIILCVISGVWYYEYRVGYDCLCVVTNGGRVIHITRGPPVGFASRCYASLGVRIDVYHIGAVVLAQVDMAVVAHCLDVIAAYPARAGRKGKVTIKAAHGFLELYRTSGDVMVIFHAMSALVDTQRVSGLPDTPFEENELYGVSPQRDIKTHAEKHVWTRQFECAGYYNDPFNYTALLTITDHRSIIVRARMPKPMSCRGICCGPRTFGNCCIWLQDLMHHTPYLTVATLGHNHLQSYASIRKRAPPFWPGLMTPVAGCTVSLLPLYMTTYPPGFAVTQRPYGDPRDVTTTDKVTLNFTSGGKLQVKHSKDPILSAGRVVDSVNGEGAQDLFEQGLNEISVEIGSDILLEAAAQEWESMADEAWLYQLRKIYDYIIKRTEEDEEILLERIQSIQVFQDLNLADSVWARLVGADMLGHRHQHATTLDTPSPLGDALGGRVKEITGEVSNRVYEPISEQTSRLAEQVSQRRVELAGHVAHQRSELTSQLQLSMQHSTHDLGLDAPLRPFWLGVGESDSDSESEGDSKQSRGGS